jgi:hypothetical protein
MDKLRIGETEYYIERKSEGNFFLVWESHTEVVKISPRTGKESGKPKTWTRYYGSLWQSLIGFVKAYMADFKGEVEISDIESRLDEAYYTVCHILDKLSDIDKAIAEEWKVVKVSSN